MPPVLGRIVRSADFERALGFPACARSPHFAIHYLDSLPGCPARGRLEAASVRAATAGKLSTDHEPLSAQPVDDLSGTAPLKSVLSVSALWLGTVVPKRHAKRSVTRSLLKRQIRAALLGLGLADQQPPRPGLWVVRLRAPFDRAAFASAASDSLRSAARNELDVVLGRAAAQIAAEVWPRPGAGSGRPTR